MAIVVCVACGLFRIVASIYNPFSVNALGRLGENFKFDRLSKKFDNLQFFLFVKLYNIIRRKFFRIVTHCLIDFTCFHTVQCRYIGVQYYLTTSDKYYLLPHLLKKPNRILRDTSFSFI